MYKRIDVMFNRIRRSAVAWQTTKFFQLDNIRLHGVLRITSCAHFPHTRISRHFRDRVCHPTSVDGMLRYLGIASASASALDWPPAHLRIYLYSCTVISPCRACPCGVFLWTRHIGTSWKSNVPRCWRGLELVNKHHQVGIEMTSLTLSSFEDARD